MSILCSKSTRLIVQGITGNEGTFHTQRMLEFGTQVVGGISPGKGGTKHLDLPVFNTVQDAVASVRPNASVIFVPAPFAADAALEAIDADIPLVVTITEGIPLHDAVKVYHATRRKGATLIGPNCPGLVTASECKIGIIPNSIVQNAGPVGVISRSGTLTYEIVHEMISRGVGISTAVGIGGDPVPGSTFIDLLPLFDADSRTKAVILVGEIGGSDEEQAAALIPTLKRLKGRVVTFISGRTAPPGKRMGHAGAIISGGHGTVAAKVEAFARAGVPVADSIPEIADRVKDML
ncbi:MAG: succinate--CoA ligase subunit alpha [bacterium]